MELGFGLCLLMLPIVCIPATVDLHCKRLFYQSEHLDIHPHHFAIDQIVIAQPDLLALPMWLCPYW